MLDTLKQIYLDYKYLFYICGAIIALLATLINSYIFIQKRKNKIKFITYFQRSLAKQGQFTVQEPTPIITCEAVNIGYKALYISRVPSMYTSAPIDGQNDFSIHSGINSILYQDQNKGYPKELKPDQKYNYTIELPPLYKQLLFKLKPNDFIIISIEDTKNNKYSGKKIFIKEIKENIDAANKAIELTKSK